MGLELVINRLDIPKALQLSMSDIVILKIMRYLYSINEAFTGRSRRTDQTNEVEACIARLVSVHGEDGVCPTADDWRAIFTLGKQEPIHILNLLAFKPQVDTGSSPISGAAAYAKYAAGVAQAFARVGGERVFFGRVGHMFGSGDLFHWDAAIVTRYPSAGALAEMWLDAEFIAAHNNRVDGVERSQVLVLR